jgi:hypothetical protein
LEDRLSHIETSIESLTAAIQGLASALSATGIFQPNSKLIALQTADRKAVSHESPGEIIEGDDGSSCYVGSSATGSFLPLATSDLKQYQQAKNVALPPGATTSLADLSIIFASTKFHNDVKSEVERARRDRELFYNSSQAEGVKLIQSMSSYTTSP